MPRAGLAATDAISDFFLTSRYWGTNCRKSLIADAKKQRIPELLTF